MALALSLAAATSAHAERLAYGIDFHVEYVDTSAALDARILVGNTYTGSFEIDSAVLLQDGINKTGDVTAFNITMEDVSWTQGRGRPWSWFAGFRGPGGQGSPSPGFDVVGGQITNLRGGVYAVDDYPFVDFSVDYRKPFPNPNEPPCAGLNCGNSSNAFFTSNPLGAFGGSLNVHVMAVPEPSTGAMALAGVALVALARRRRRRDAIDAHRRR